MSFEESQGKLRMAMSTSATRDRPLHLPSTSFEHKTARSLVGSNFDEFTRFGMLETRFYYFRKYLPVCGLYVHEESFLASAVQEHMLRIT